MVDAGGGGGGSGDGVGRDNEDLVFNGDRVSVQEVENSRDG